MAPRTLAPHVQAALQRTSQGSGSRTGTWVIPAPSHLPEAKRPPGGSRSVGQPFAPARRAAPAPHVQATVQAARNPLRSSTALSFPSGGGQIGRRGGIVQRMEEVAEVSLDDYLQLCLEYAEALERYSHRGYPEYCWTERQVRLRCQGLCPAGFRKSSPTHGRAVHGNG
jgi:hypothetical protein